MKNLKGRRDNGVGVRTIHNYYNDTVCTHTHSTQQANGIVHTHTHTLARRPCDCMWMKRQHADMPHHQNSSQFDVCMNASAYKFRLVGLVCRSSALPTRESDPSTLIQYYFIRSSSLSSSSTPLFWMLLVCSLARCRIVACRVFSLSWVHSLSTMAKDDGWIILLAFCKYFCSGNTARNQLIGDILNIGKHWKTYAKHIAHHTHRACIARHTQLQQQIGGLGIHLLFRSASLLLTIFITVELNTF